MNTATDQTFAARVHAALDDLRQPYRGRQIWLLRRLKDEGLVVSQAAVHKWFAGQSVPELNHMSPISKVLGVKVEWLAFGSGPMRTSDQFGTDEIAAVVTMMSGMTPAQQRTLKRIAETAFEQTEPNSRSA